MKKTGWLTICLACGYCIMVSAVSYAQDQAAPPADQSVNASILESDQPEAITDSLAAAQNVTLDFKEADINSVLKIIAYKAGINIVTTPEVIGNVTIRLVDVPWEKALDVILKTHGFGYDRQGSIITVAPIEKLTSMKKQETELAQVQPVITEVFNLKYIDAQDAKKALEPQLSPRGRITILEMTGQAGWEFGAADPGKRRRLAEEKLSRSKVLIVSDIAPALERTREALAKIDVMQKQVLIETRIMEVSRDKLKDFGFDYGTGTVGAESSAISTVGNSRNAVGGHNLSSQVTPSLFSPKASGTSGISGTEPFNTGFELIYQKLTGTEFEVMVHALEEDVHSNTLSAPRILAMNNQEANILVGTRYPILKTETTGAGSTAVSTVTLDYYQDIGIQLNVVPQIGADNMINMVIHPAVSSFTSTIGTNLYPIIDTREAETRILIRNGETVVIGGLLKDVKSTNRQGIPFLSKIPLLGVLFSRETNDLAKIDLVIFITARVVGEGELTAEQIAQIKENLGKVESWSKPLKDKKVHR